MADIVTRFSQLGLPADECVVIGSGLLDALGLREAHDIDLAVSPALFEQLRVDDTYAVHQEDTTTYLTKGDVEVWPGWHSDAPYDSLKRTAVAVKGVYFVNPAVLIERKSAHGRAKDLADIALLEKYLATHEF